MAKQNPKPDHVGAARVAWRAKLEPYEREHALRFDAHAKLPPTPEHEAAPLEAAVAELRSAVAAQEQQCHECANSPDAAVRTAYFGRGGEPHRMRLHELHVARAKAENVLYLARLGPPTPVPSAEHDCVADAARISDIHHEAAAAARATDDAERERQHLCAAIGHDHHHGLDTSVARAALDALDGFK